MGFLEYYVLVGMAILVIPAVLGGGKQWGALFSVYMVASVPIFLIYAIVTKG